MNIKGITIDDNEWEEIDREENDTLPINGTARVDGIYFKKKVKPQPKFPKVFKFGSYSIELNGDHDMKCTRLADKTNGYCYVAISEVEEAIKYWRENK